MYQKAPGTGLPGTVEQVVHCTFCQGGNWGWNSAFGPFAVPCLLAWNWPLFRGQGAFSFIWSCFPLAKPGTPDNTSFYVIQDTVVVWWHWCSQPFTPSCIQALSSKLCCALLLLKEYSAPFIVSGLCHLYCFSSWMLSHVIQTEAWKNACNIPTCSFFPLLSPWEHAQLAHWRKRHMQQKHQVTPAPGDTHGNPQTWREPSQDQQSHQPACRWLQTREWVQLGPEKLPSLTDRLTYSFKPLNVGIICYTSLQQQFAETGASVLAEITLASFWLYWCLQVQRRMCLSRNPHKYQVREPHFLPQWRSEWSFFYQLQGWHHYTPKDRDIFPHLWWQSWS